jgi:hypothetical protein
VLSKRLLDLTDDQMYRAARKLAGTSLTPEDALLDIGVGSLRRFRDNGTDKAVGTPKRWARAIPIARGITIVTSTRIQVLFLGDGFGVNCPLVRMHRAEEQAGHRQIFAFGRSGSPLSVLELELSRHQNDWPGQFLERLLAIRDEERAKLPPDDRENLGKLDQMIQGLSLDEIWNVRQLSANS